MVRKNITWLFEQMPLWINLGLISHESSQKLREYYEKQSSLESKNSRNAALGYFSILGALFIAGGIILLLAHNWEQLTRSARASLSFALILLGQVSAGCFLFRSPHSGKRNEALALFAQLTFGAGMALVAQTYHLSDDFNAFLLTWMLCTLPLVYVFEVASTSLVYLVGILSWTWSHYSWAHSGSNAKQFFWFWISLLFPFALKELKKNPFHTRTSFIFWGLCLVIPQATLVCLRGQWHNLEIVAFCGIFGTFYFMGSLWQNDPGVSFWKKPLQRVGQMGLILTGFTLTYYRIWKHIGPDSPFYSKDISVDIQYWKNFHDLVVSGLFIALSSGLFVMSLKRKKTQDSLLSWLPMIILPSYLICYWFKGPLVPVVFTIGFNIYFFAVGFVMAMSGLRERNLSKFNVGMLLTIALIMARFFDSKFSFIVRGIVFIALGFAFILLNYFYSKHQNQASKGAP